MNRRSSYADLLARTVAGWRAHPVVVVGDVMLDEWRFTEPQRLCREAPVPVVALRRQLDAAGGAGNTAVNLAALGARPVLVAPTGADAVGDRVRACLANAGVAIETVTVRGRPTCVKRRVVAGGQILFCEEAGRHPAPMPAGAVDRLLDRLTAAAAGAAGPAPALVVCDYGLGALDDRVRRWLVANRDRFGMVALDAHDLGPWTGLRPTVVTPNYAEAASLFVPPPVGGGGQDRTAVALEHARDLLARTGAQVAAVTLDVAGAVVASAGGAMYRTRGHPAPAAHTVGAGDAYLAAMALALAVAAEVPVAAELAQLAAAATLDGTGTCVCQRQALLEAVYDAPLHDGGRLVDAAALVGIVRQCRDRGARVVFTNGCFDVLHRGHVCYLTEARQLGDVLIVAVNSDASVRRLKGPDRPVNHVEDRAAVLAGLSCVDFVVVFEEDSPAPLIEAVRPDVYVKGGDYRPEMVPEAPLVRRLGGTVRTLGYVPDRSTSAVIGRIRSHSTVVRR
jgi:rfaE bifunctional protein nucleotidyltransferase chain/domain/rfaE bifunctional protein kinase chain/domain